MSTLREIFRRKGRSALTISGIAIGMFALVVLGAASENMNVYMERASAYFKTAVMVMDAQENGPAGLPSGNRPLAADKIAQAAKQPGVAACLPMVTMLLDDSVVTVGASAPPMIIGLSAETEKYDKFWGMAKGRYWQAGERSVAVAGEDFARRRRLATGDTVEVKGERFEVIGILERSYISLNDSSVYIPVEQAREMYLETLPDVFKKSVKPEESSFAAYAYPKPGYSAEDIARNIEKGVPGVKSLDQKKTLESVGPYISLFHTFIASLAGLGLLIGALTIVNTMMMSVSERTRELGVMRALGASRISVATNILAESAVMGALGGLGGIVLGALASVALGGAVTMSTGVNMFMLTWRLVAFAMGFAVLLGTLAGLYPAWHAALMDPVVALAQE